MRKEKQRQSFIRHEAEPLGINKTSAWFRIWARHAAGNFKCRSCLLRRRSNAFMSMTGGLKCQQHLSQVAPSAK